MRRGSATISLVLFGVESSLAYPVGVGVWLLGCGFQFGGSDSLDFTGDMVEERDIVLVCNTLQEQFDVPNIIGYTRYCNPRLHSLGRLFHAF
jgi:hypothetical protein